MDVVEVYRSFWRPSCDERALVLHAMGIASQIRVGRTPLGTLRRYRKRNAGAGPAQALRAREPTAQPPCHTEPMHRGAWLGSLAYALLVLAVGFLAGNGAFNADWLDAGALRSVPVRAGETWRAVTALTLHLDVGHMLSNLGFGTVFGLLAGQLLGPGVAWASVLAAAASANLLNAWVQPQVHSSVGASTAVFATLGLLAAYAWRRRSGETGGRAYRWAPLIAGVFLLAFTGVGGENTDVLAHLTGFVMGALVGVLHAAWRVPRGPVAQFVAGAAALIVVAAAWAYALV